ncbi:hypothetical protein HY095_05290 [Candidatus Micrarchaeota archaeon]|nr:hypothetical protein [Candidatus Micrarchaeota archaeon]
MYGLFLGIHCGDGSLPKYARKNVYWWEFCDEDEEAAKFVAELVARIFGVTPHIKKRGNRYVVYVQSKKMWLQLTQEFGLPVGRKAEIISMPSCVAKSEWKDFVNGVIGCDGVVFFDSDGKPRIRLRVRSKKLRDDVSRVLTEFGIHHTVGEAIEKSRVPTSDKIYRCTMYRLDLYGTSAEKYFDQIGCWHFQKVRKFSKNSFTKDSVKPVQVPLAEQAKTWQENQGKGIRQISPVTSG